MTALAADVERLSARLAGAPEIFFAPVDPVESGSVALTAVVADLFRERASGMPSDAQLAVFTTFDGLEPAARREARKHGALVLFACWLLHDPVFAGAGAERLLELLGTRLRDLSRLVARRAFVDDPDRREELVRVCLDALGMVPHAESAADAEDRMATLDSVKRARLLREAKEREQARVQERERRRRELEELRRQEAEREAARVTHED